MSLLVTSDKTIVMLLRKPRSKWLTLVCIGRKRHYRKNGSCRHTEAVLESLLPTVRKRTRVHGFGGRAANDMVSGGGTPSA